MTREEEIKNAANEYCKNIDYSDYANIDVYDAFIAGVEWSDAHQRALWISDISYNELVNELKDRGYNINLETL
jgi:hypothetical protein